MVYKNFRVNFIIRTAFLVATIFLFFFIWFKTDLTMTLFLVGITIGIQTYAFISYIDRTNRILNNFLESIRYSDFTRTFHIEGESTSFEKLKNSFNEVIKDFQEVRAEKEENFYYLQTVIQHIGIALIAFQKDGTVELINNATKKLFHISNLKNIETLKGFNKKLVEQLFAIQHGEKALIKVQEKEDLLQLIIYATEFTIHNRRITLVSIKNIQQELEEKEMESWQKLIRVLTHEIMNSITPISSLSSTVNLIIDELSTNLDKQCVSDEDIETLSEVSTAIKTIHKRTDGLLHFVNTYRNLTKIPKPIFSIFNISFLFHNIKQLFEEEIKVKKINCEINIEPENLELSADEHLIEQVLINLIKNAIHALENTKEAQIQLIAKLNSRGKITIQVIDNGPGILPDVLERIFIPFFTTKPQGSGIGLSLSRQILRLHGATINAYSEPDVKTKFTLTF